MKKINKKYKKAKVWDECQDCRHLLMCHNIYSKEHICLNCYFLSKKSSKPAKKGKKECNNENCNIPFIPHTSPPLKVSSVKKDNKECYCVCHSPFSSRPACVHCFSIKVKKDIEKLKHGTTFDLIDKINEIINLINKK